MRCYCFFTMGYVVHESGPPIQRYPTYGDVAQLGERLVCNQVVAGSIPVISTLTRNLNGQ